MTKGIVERRATMTVLSRDKSLIFQEQFANRRVPISTRLVQSSYSAFGRKIWTTILG